MKTTIVFVSLITISLMYISLALADIENLARGGDFENDEDIAQWRLNLGNAGVGTMTIDDDNAAIDECSLFIDNINFDPAESWKPQIDQSDIWILEKNTVYTISAFLKAENQRPLGMYSEIPVDPWTKVPNKVVNVGTEWKEYWATGIPPGPQVTIGFKNEGSKISYWIDGVRFYVGEYQPTLEEKAVMVTGKLTISWGKLKAEE
jgi:hypothetical protein